jgi:hypothetical protein
MFDFRHRQYIYIFPQKESAVRPFSYPTGSTVSLGVKRLRREALHQWFSTSGRDPNHGRWGSNVGSREGFMENSIIMKNK